MNVQSVRVGLTPLYIKVEEKKNYMTAMEQVDTEKNYPYVYVCNSEEKFGEIACIQISME